MSTISAPLADSRIMLRRNLKHILRNPVTIFNAAVMPVVLMLLLVYVFGNAFNVGEHYVEYATPGLIVLAITYGLAGTAVSVSSDMTKGIINRFKVMNVSRGAVLTQCHLAKVDHGFRGVPGVCLRSRCRAGMIGVYGTDWDGGWRPSDRLDLAGRAGVRGAQGRG